MISRLMLSAFLLLAFGCGARTEYRAARLDISREGWDTLYVVASFSRNSTIGRERPVIPDSVQVVVLNARYDTLYTGAPGIVPVDDERLGDGERMTVEACGVIRRRQLCVQDFVESSPKRYTVRAEVEYPVEGDFERGRYDLVFRAEREKYGGDGWERVDAPPPRGYVLTWVDHRDAPREGTIQIPFSRPRGRFDLSSYPNYRNFKFFLDSRLMDDDRVNVNFAVYAGTGPEPEHLTTLVRVVERKTESERGEDVHFFARQAVEELIDRLAGSRRDRRAAATIEDWQFDSDSRSYQIRIVMEWRRRFFGRYEYEIEGVLAVNEDGSEPVFRLVSGTRRGVEEWERRVPGDEIRLDDFEPRDTSPALPSLEEDQR